MESIGLSYLLLLKRLTIVLLATFPVENVSALYMLRVISVYLNNYFGIMSQGIVEVFVWETQCVSAFADSIFCLSQPKVRSNSLLLYFLQLSASIFLQLDKAICYVGSLNLRRFLVCVHVVTSNAQKRVFYMNRYISLYIASLL